MTVIDRTARRLFAIDPGTRQSGWVILDRGRVLDSGVHDNHDLLRWVKDGQGADMLAIEMMMARGMPTSNEEMETLVWIGRFKQRWSDFYREHPATVQLVYRQHVKMALCGTMKAKDTNIRQALLDIFPATGGGATPQVGTKAKPGPLHGVSSHAWSALAVAITVCERLKLREAMPLMPQFELDIERAAA
jgi:hypothetical protein